MGEPPLHDLIIAGAGVHGREMAEIVERINHVRPKWNLLGYLAPHDRADLVGSMHNGSQFLGTVSDLSGFPSAWFVPDNERYDVDRLPPERLADLVDPSAFVSRTVRMGGGCVIYPHCFLGCNVSLGRRVFCLAGSTINHDCVLADQVTLCANVTLAGGVQVQEQCYLGQGCTVRQNLRIGAGSIVGMGAVVVRSVEPQTIVAGNPARTLRRKGPS